MREVGHAAASNGASIKSSRLAVPTAAGALSLKPLGPRSARAVLWTCPVQVRRSALGNYCLGNYYLLANGLVFFVFSHLFTCARDRAYLALGLCLSLATRRGAALHPGLFRLCRGG